MWDDEKKPDMMDKRVKVGAKRMGYLEYSNGGSRTRSKIPPLLIKRLYDLIII
jgi:hypothetical protein